MDGARVDKENKKLHIRPIADLTSADRTLRNEKRIPNNNEFQVLVFAKDKLCSLAAIVIW